jgi:hypothetical protein
MKKNYFTTMLLSALSSYCFGQTATVTNSLAPPEENIPSAFQVGFGVGVNKNISKTGSYNYYISPIDNTLQRDKINDVSYVGSVIISYTPLWTFVKIDNDKNPISGSAFKAPGLFSILASLDLANFNSSTSFNTKLNGGIGFGINIQNVMQIGLFVDFYQEKVLRSGIANNLHSKITINNSDLTSLDPNDSKYFYNDFKQSFSLKFIYNFSKHKSDIRTGIGSEADVDYKFNKGLKK